MTEPTEFDLIELATPYALNAISETERAAIDRQLAAAPAAVAGRFGDEVRAVRETMAVVSAATGAEPPARSACAECWPRYRRMTHVDHVGAQQHWLRRRQ